MNVGLAYVGVAIFVVLVFFAWVLGRRLKLVTTLEHFLYTAREGMPWVVMGPAMVALWIYGGSLMGASEAGFAFGGSGIYVYAFFLSSQLAMWLFFRRFKRQGGFRNALSVSHYVRTRFDKKNYYYALFSGGYIVLGVAIYCIIGAMYTLTGLTGGAIPLWVGGLLVTVFTAVYLFTGGFYYSALVAFATAVVVAVVMVAGGASFWFRLGDLGGLSVITQGMDITNAQFPGWSNWFYIVGYTVFAPVSLMCGFAVGSDNAYFNFGIATKRTDWGKMLGSSFVFVAAVLLIAGLVGFAGRVLADSGLIAPPGTSSEILPHMLSLFAPTGIAVLFVVVTFLAASTTIAIGATAFGAITGRDFYGAAHPEASEQKIRKIVNTTMAIILVASLVFALAVRPGIVQWGLYIYGWSIYWGFNVVTSAVIPWLHRHFSFAGGVAGFIAFHIFSFGLKMDPGLCAAWSLLITAVISLGGSAIYVLPKRHERGFNLDALPQMLRETAKRR